MACEYTPPTRASVRRGSFDVWGPFFHVLCSRSLGFYSMISYRRSRRYNWWYCVGTCSALCHDSVEVGDLIQYKRKTRR
ncbi:uncharacterized protein ASPGLDRAFT_280823 [Aspergillus glaucus CBS 516.65]|uniref:Uncharacterized protein n=1 Tax=Aspergillus glaucus CBS 516.65 TaxID=1160497 RepID=A0A1L9W0J5_ASPGL|nr:hypothetical protein ASPGLDRAFT_280823 [Aspergillus glaucus CBS 516.65]OJJ89669.1 hypothetical protein ASPGLDRAFT_280823 [Aspergillus glaucus CBS 516.65]